jgi:hypothetical protein
VIQRANLINPERVDAHTRSETSRGKVYLANYRAPSYPVTDPSATARPVLNIISNQYSSVIPNSGILGHHDLDEDINTRSGSDEKDRESIRKRVRRGDSPKNIQKSHRRDYDDAPDHASDTV